MVEFKDFFPPKHRFAPRDIANCPEMSNSGWFFLGKAIRNGQKLIAGFSWGGNPIRSIRSEDVRAPRWWEAAIGAWRLPPSLQAISASDLAASFVSW
jgi:hypothetical protein